MANTQIQNIAFKNRFSPISGVEGGLDKGRRRFVYFIISFLRRKNMAQELQI